VKVDMQAVLDSTALMTSKNAATMSSTQTESAAHDNFLSLFTRPDANDVHITTSYSNNDGSTLVVTASADMNTDFMGVLGFKTITVTSSSTREVGTAAYGVGTRQCRIDSAERQNGHAEDGDHQPAGAIAERRANDGDVYVSINPFSNDVSVDARTTTSPTGSTGSTGRHRPPIPCPDRLSSHAPRSRPDRNDVQRHRHQSHQAASGVIGAAQTKSPANRAGLCIPTLITQHGRDVTNYFAFAIIVSKGL
jgi:hypothetical protein